VIEAGSSQASTSTWCAACAKLTTLSDSPAAVSMMRTSRLCVSSLKAWMSPAFSRASSSAMRFLPDAAGTISTPCGPATMMSSSRHSPASTWLRLCSGWSPSSTSTLARPKSASSSIARRPCIASAIARFTAAVVLPTPPLPLDTAMTFTGCCMRRSPLA